MKGIDKDNKKLYFGLFILLGIFLLNSISAIEENLNYSSSNVVQVRQLKYEPYPVTPGEYFNVWISIQGKEGKYDEWEFELVTNYPFSLDPDEDPVRNYGHISSPSIVLKYRVRVDEDALDGTYDLFLKYTVNGIEYSSPLSIEVEDSRTAFDAVIQEISGSDISIAIANIGKHTANSVIIRIPEQEYFEASEISGQMIGNLDSGDYNIVSFSLSPIMQRNAEPAEPENSQEFQNLEDTNLKFDIYYTDTLGERRVVNMELPLKMDLTSTFIGETGEETEDFFAGMPGMRKRSFWSGWYTFAIILIIVGIIIFVLYKKYPKQTKEFYNKIKQRISKPSKKKKARHKDTSASVPDWMNNFREKEKKK